MEERGWLKLMKVKDFMIRDVICLDQNSSVKTLLETLVQKKIGGVPVLNEKKELIGVVSDGDVLRHLQPKSYIDYNISYIEELDDTIVAKSESSIKTIMKKRVISVKEEDTLDTVLKVLSTHHFKKLPVINNEKYVIGVVSRGDLVKKLAEKVLDKL